MTEIANSLSNILVPIISHAQPVPSPPSTGTEPETTRHPREARLFIVPKQPSCPLPLDNRRSLRDSSKSSPFFQNFQLDLLFSKK